MKTHSLVGAFLLLDNFIQIEKNVRRNIVDHHRFRETFQQNQELFHIHPLIKNILEKHDNRPKIFLFHNYCIYSCICAARQVSDCRNQFACRETLCRKYCGTFIEVLGVPIFFIGGPGSIRFVSVWKKRSRSFVR